MPILHYNSVKNVLFQTWRMLPGILYIPCVLCKEKSYVDGKNNLERIVATERESGAKVETRFGLSNAKQLGAGVTA